MLTLWDRPQSNCSGISRRGFLQVGALGLGGMSMVDLFRAHAQGAFVSGRKPKKVIMVVLAGGPTQFETYDMKPNAPVEIRGEMNPIQTNVPGINVCELLPLHAKIADKLAIVRGIDFMKDDGHSKQLVYTGYPRGFINGRAVAGQRNRPSFGVAYNHLRDKSIARSSSMPPYVSMIRDTAAGNGGGELVAYGGVENAPFTHGGGAVANMGLAEGMTLSRLDDRRKLLQSVDRVRRDMDTRGQLEKTDEFTQRAFGVISSPEVREAFDLSKEPDSVWEKYGGDNRYFRPDKLILARRLVEAGVNVVTLHYGGGWDTHGKNFEFCREELPKYDQGIHALVTDIYERGLDEEVAVLVWGEMGRAPTINEAAGRHHWAPAGIALMAGAVNTGQVVGETDPRGDRAVGKPYNVQNMLATVYHLLGVDPGSTIPDHQGRPVYLLDHTEPVRELL